MTSWTPNIAHSRGPRYLAIANAIMEAVDKGKLRAGTRLPTHRDLAYRLGVSVQTVSSAYSEAERRGYVSGEIGRGTFVQVRSRENETRFIMDRREEDLIDLSIVRPVSDHLHVTRLRKAFATMGNKNDFGAMLACRPVGGLDRHRVAAAKWLRRSGVVVPSSQIILCNGAAHALLVALATLTSPGDLVVTESLTDHGIISLSRMLNLRLEGLATDKHGILPDGFEAVCHSGEVKALCCTPCFANPTATLMPEDRRKKIAAIARDHDVAIVEDDVFGPLLSDRPAPLWSFAPEISYYVTSFSKLLVSGLRTGYLVGPSHMIPRLTTRLRASSWMATPLVAEIASRWIDDGTAEELVQWQSKELSARQMIVRRTLDGFDYACHANSIHGWLTLPAEWRAENFVTQARLQNVAVTPAEPFVVGRTPQPHAIRISVGAAESHAQLEQGARTLADLLIRAPEPAYIPF